MTGFRKFLLNVHLWIGLVACLLLFVLGLTGAFLVFEYKIDHLFNPALSYVTPQAQRLPLEELANNVKAHYPKARLLGADLSASSPNPDLAYSFNILDGKERLQVFVDQYTGHVLGSRAPAHSFTVRVHQLHTNLLGGAALKLVTTWGSLLLCLLALSGIYLWWPRKIFVPNLKASGRRINFDLHNSIGFYASFFVFIFAFTAVVMHWEDELFPLANFVTHSPSDALDPQLSSALVPVGTQSISLDRVVEIATQKMPGARVTQISLPSKPKDTIRTWMKYPEDGTPAGRTWLYIDQFSGQVLWARNSRTAPLGTRYMKSWNREIHTGDIFGWPSKIVAFLASLSVAFLSISGPLIWLLKKTKKKPLVARLRHSDLQKQTV